MSLVAFLIAAVAPAVLADPAQEARAQSLEREIRCVQCENEPIAQSTADIAGDMRALVRERVAAGDSDAEIRAFFRQRYGDFVLFRPPLDARTWALWAAPLVLIGAGLAAVLSARRGQGGASGEIVPEEGER
ncbi:MAG: cytochrome c-type biogenesis protein CcmH [Hyphomonadaceae bacterium]